MQKETIVELLSLLLEKESGGSKLPVEIGEKYFVRTVTHYVVGKLEEISGGFLVFSSASWIADTGRFTNFLTTGEASEVEPVPGLYRVAIGSVVDIFDWQHDLPKKQK